MPNKHSAEIRRELYFLRWDHVKQNLAEAKANPSTFAQTMKANGMYASTTGQSDALMWLKSMIARIDAGKGPQYKRKAGAVSHSGQGSPPVD